MRRDDDELLAAYADGVTELSADERARVEAMLATTAGARDELAATRSMIERVRELPAPGGEPDWAAMQRAISAAVGDRVPTVSRWRTLLAAVGVGPLRWMVPVGACAAFAAVLWLALAPGSQDLRVDRHDGPTATIPVHPDAGTVATAPKTVVKKAAAEPALVYIDGEALDIGTLDANDLTDDDDDGGDVTAGALLASPDLGWIDHLDADKLDHLEQSLKQGT